MFREDGVMCITENMPGVALLDVREEVVGIARGICWYVSR